MGVQANIERRSDSMAMLHTLLETRNETLVLYSQLVGIRPFKPKLEVQELLQEFCESLVDYTASAHFQLYRFVADGTERRKDIKRIAEGIYPRISAITQQILDFNDKYENEEQLDDFSSLDSDLSMLGEALAERIQQEDKIIEVLMR